MTGLKNKRIGIAADRSGDSIARLVANMGGESTVLPIQGKQILNEDTCEQNLTDFLNEDFDWVILTTGIGGRTLGESAQYHGLNGAFIEKLGKENLAVRGSKTVNWLKENNLSPHIISEDGTMKDLIERLSYQERKGRVFLQAYNQDDVLLKHSLEDIGYSVYLSKPYSFEAPVPNLLDELTSEIISSQIDAAIFTSKTQVRNLFAAEVDQKDLIEAFNRDVLAVAVGKVTAKELEDKGIANVLQPEKPKMGAMVVELDRYFRDHAPAGSN
ncbi:uroporphyrinogen-III synthase [Halobacillus dabanensis]|uniref:Uroporphyrinogen-III synthase n=1 Tax=Halobacillus dabanensis TaxID=240302 RepID=A0A1I3VKI6_HALDA|nr:uroporphyrinogen-III synthase [Halobacillus dabanensis]SFJ94641.1 uroporphyrinogen-III synthase [Halobacillus dabanensis]